MTQPPQHTTRRHFHCLDTLRGIAALLVAIFHLSNNRFGFAGYVLVDFFLVLSGFVLAHSYLYRSVAVGKWEFAVRRFARLWPMHVVALFLMYGAIYYPLYGRFFSEPGSNAHNTPYTLLQHLTLTHNIGLPPTGPYVLTWNMPSWSISVEFWVNILFILLISKRTKNLAMLVLSVICLGIVYRGSGSLEASNENYYMVLNSGMLRGVASFVLGIISYRQYMRYKDRSVGIGLATGVEILCAALVVFFLYAKHWGVPEYELLAPFAFTLMVPFFACERGLISKASVPFKYLGAVSYSVYLNHMAVLILISHPSISKRMGENSLLALQVVVLLILSHFTFRHVEKPAQRFLLKRLLPKRA